MLIGNLTRDPEIKYTPKGTAIAAFGLAVNRNYTTEGGEKPLGKRGAHAADTVGESRPGLF